MFTGIIQGIGRVKEIKNRGRSGKITIDTTLDTTDLGEGDSIAVDGVCLTVTSITGNTFTADISEETLKCTTMGYIKKGAMVNLEKSLRMGDRLGGHLVAGHVDGLGVISRRERRGEGEVFEISTPPELIRYMVKKGSIAVDGISLTIANLLEKGFEVLIIPYTLKSTTISLKREGAKVNIETDIIGKYIHRFFSLYAGKDRIDKSFLIEHGFMNKTI